MLKPIHSKFPLQGGAYFGRWSPTMLISGLGVDLDVSAFTVNLRTRSLAISPEDRDLTESPRSRSLSIPIPDRPVE